MQKKFLTDKDKIQAILQFYQIKITEFAKKIGVDDQQIYGITGGKTQWMSNEILSGIAKNCPEISLYWLITGEHSIEVADNHHNAIANNHSTATVNHTDTDATIARLTAVIEQQTQQINSLLQLLQSK